MAEQQRFSGPWGKLVRARDLINELQQTLREYQESDPFEYPLTSNSSDHSDRYLRMQWRLLVKEPVPLRASWVLGDIVHNLRSSLDICLSELARVTYGFSHEEITKPRRLQFPIADTPGKFPRKDLRSWFPDEVVSIIERHQPYNSEENFADGMDSLQLLRDLSNLDKHRQIIVSMRSLVDFKFSSNPEAQEVHWRLGDTHMVDGATLATLKFKRPLTDGDIDLVPEFHHIETILAPIGPGWLPMALTLESMFDAAFDAVLELTSDAMTPWDHHWAAWIIESASDREDNVRRATGIPLVEDTKTEAAP